MIAYFFIPFIFSFILCFYAKDRFFIDQPNHRSSHTLPTSRFGGTAMGISLFGTLGIGLWLYDFLILTHHFIALCALILLWGVGVVDDYRHLPPKIKVIAQSIFCGLILYAGYVLPLPESIKFLELPFSFFMFLCFINAANYCDSLNGLWGGICLLSFIPFFLFSENFLLFISGFSIQVILGFYWFNLRGKIFMGDAGSMLLGGILLLTALTHCQHYADVDVDVFHFYRVFTFSLMFLIFPFTDIVITALRRLAQGYSIMEPHKEHYAQKLNQLGFSHIKVTLIYLFFSLVIGINFIGCGFLLLYKNYAIAIGCLLLHLIFCGSIFYAIDRKFKKLKG